MLLGHRHVEAVETNMIVDGLQGAVLLYYHSLFCVSVHTP